LKRAEVYKPSEPSYCLHVKLEA